MGISERLLLLVVIAMAFSCQRAVQETSKISIQLPASVGSSKVSGLSSGSSGTPIAASDEDKNNDFLDTIPTDYAGDSPINCYAVVVAANDAAFKKNYCGKKDALNNVGRDLQFGPMVGLIADGNKAEFELDVGKNRRFYILGFNAINEKSCRDIADSPEKYNLSKPYVVGDSGSIDLTGGDQNVVIQLTSVSTTKYYDDCVITDRDSELKFPVADSVRIDNNSFPYNFFRRPTGGLKNCEPLTMILKANGEQRGTVGAASTGSVEYSNTSGTGYSAINTFPTSQECLNTTNGSPNFVVLKNETEKTRWVQVPDMTLVYFKATIAGITSVEYAPPMTISSALLSDTVVPKQAEPNTCYRITTYFKKLLGTPTVVTGGPSLGFTTDVAGAASFYSSLDCTGAPLTGQTIPAVDALNYSMRTSSGTQSFKVVLSSGAFIDTGAKVNFPEKPSSNTEVAALRIQGKTYLPGTVGECSPINITPVDENGRSQATVQVGTLNVLPGASVMANIELFSEGACSVPLVGPIAVPAGKQLVTVWVKAKQSPIYTEGHIQFIYTSILSGVTANGRFDFTVFNPVSF